MATSVYGKYTKSDSKILRLLTYSPSGLPVKRTAFLLGERVVDLQSASKLYVYSNEKDLFQEGYAEALAPTDMLSLISLGEGAINHAQKVYAFVQDLLDDKTEVKGVESEKLVYELSQVRVRAPLRPRKIIHTAGNFREHAKEGEEAGWPFPIPQWISFLKNPDSVIGHDDEILKPSFTKQLDHELEMGIIIDKKMKNVSPQRAYEGIFGFTVFNDVTARDIQREEMKNGLLNFGKNLDTFAPLGPVIVPKNQIGDPHNLTMELRVNGDVRQFGSTSRLSVRIEEIVAKYSWVTLYPGDMISTGTISGVAAFRKPDPTPYFLKHGDVLECEIEKIGLLRNTVVNAE